MLNRGEILKQHFNQSIGLPWQEILPESRIEEILVDENIQYRNCVYTPIVTQWALISQVLDPDKSLSNAVKRIIPNLQRYTTDNIWTKDEVTENGRSL
jgi:hypothetical protein